MPVVSLYDPLADLYMYQQQQLAAVISQAEADIASAAQTALDAAEPATLPATVLTSAQISQNSLTASTFDGALSTVSSQLALIAVAQAAQGRLVKMRQVRHT